MGGKSSNRVKKTLRERFGAVRTWQLIIILVPLLFLTATLLRFNHLRMSELRAAVFAADEAEDDEQIRTSLIALRDFVYSHTVVNVVESNGVQSIIFGTGPFYLEHQYLRAANAAIEQAKSELITDDNPHRDVYATIEATCQPQAVSWNAYLNCWTSEMEKYPVEIVPSTNIAAKVPSTELYRHNYASPLWSPTPAGFAMLASAIILIIIIVRFVIWCALKLALVFLQKA